MTSRSRLLALSLVVFYRPDRRSPKAQAMSSSAARTTMRSLFSMARRMPWSSPSRPANGRGT